MTTIRVLDDLPTHAAAGRDRSSPSNLLPAAPAAGHMGSADHQLHSQRHLPIVVWLMRDYFQKRACRARGKRAIDGASPYRIFRSIVLPLAVRAWSRRSFSSSSSPE